MSFSKGRTTAFVAAVVALFALTMAGAASAHPGGDGAASAGGCSRGTATGEGTLLTNSFAFTVCGRGRADQDVSGFFRAVAIPPASGLVAPQGPVTCAAFAGDEVSFLYPLTEGSRPPFPPGSTAILIYAKAGGPGVGRVGFTPPLPTAAFGNRCDLASPPAIATKASAQPVTSGSVAVTGARG